MSQQPDIPREDSFRDARKQIVHSAFLALAALGVIVFACYAWFVSNNSVTGKISSVLLNGSTFELASVGNNSTLDDNIPWDDNLDHTPIPWEDNNTSYQTTAEYRRSVLWRLTSDSNFGNYPKEGTQTASGIQPGDHGKIQFYVIPKKAGKLTLDISLELIPLNEAFQKINDDPIANRLLKSHILFSYAVGDSQFSLLNYDDANLSPSFRLELTGCEVNKPIRVTLKWIWPYLLENVLENELYITDDSSKIVELMNNRPEDFFYGGDFTDKKDINKHRREFNELFNNADQYIGNHVHAVLLGMTAAES